MLITPHILVGSSIAAATGNYPLIFILGIASHFLLDAIPHADWNIWHHKEENFKLNRKDYLLVILDLAASLILFLWLVMDKKYDFFLIAAGCFSASLVDIIDNVPFWKQTLRSYPIFKQLHQIHKFFQFDFKPKYWLWGIATQAVIILASILYLGLRY